MRLDLCTRDGDSGVKRRALALLLACLTGVSFFGLVYSLGLTGLFRREAQYASNAHYGILTLLPAEAPEYDPGANAWLDGDPRRSLIPLLTDDQYEKLNKHSTAYPIHPRYMTLGVSAEYCRLTPPEGYYDYADRLVLEATVQAVDEETLELTGCVFLGGKEEATGESITALLLEELAETWSVGDRTEFSLRTWQENGIWLYRVDKELVPKGGTKAEDVVSMAEDNLHGFDLVFTEDMRWIWRIMQGELRCVQGRMIEAGDEGSRVCVVSECFLRENGLELGDSLLFRVGDKLCSQFAPIGAVAYTSAQYPRRWVEEAFEIIGTFADTDNGSWTADEFAYAYSESTVFVPLSTLPETIYRSSARYTPAELTLLPEDGDTLERKLGWMEEIVAPMGLRCVMDDRGWPEIAAGISGENARLRAKTLPILAGAVIVLFLVSLGLFLLSRRKCAVLILAGAPKKRVHRRVLLLPSILLWAAAGAGTAAAVLRLRAQLPDLTEVWSGFMQVSGRKLPLGIMLLLPGAVSLILSGCLIPGVLLHMRQDVHSLSERMQRKAGKE